MDDEDDESTLLCGSKGQITLDEQHRYVRAKQQVHASNIECGKYSMLLDETHQRMWQCRERLQTLSGRRDQTAAQLRQAGRAGRHASLGYLRDRLAGLEANMAQQHHQRHQLAHRLAALEKYSAATAFNDGKLVSTKFFVNEMEKDFEQRKQAQKSCYIHREEKLAKIYQDSVCQREERDRRTLRALAGREDQLRQQAEDAAGRMDLHVSNTLKTLQRQQKQKLLASERQRQRRSDAVRQFARQLEYTREVLRVQQRLPAHGAGQSLAGQQGVPDGAQKLQAHLHRRRATLAAAEQNRLDLAARQRSNTRRIVARLVQEERRRLQEEPSRPPPSPLRPRRPHRAPRRPRSLPPLTAEEAERLAVPTVTTGGGGAGGAGGCESVTEPTGSAVHPSSSASAGLGESTEFHEGEDTPSRRVSSGSSTPPGESAPDGRSQATKAASRLSAGDLERLQQLLDTSAATGGDGGGDGEVSGEGGSLDDSLLAVGQQWPLKKPNMPVDRPPVSSDPCPFSWKPNTIEFRDFQVGWTYHRRVQIVNLSRTRSSCRYIGLYEHDYYQLQQPLADCMRVHFQPPGFLGTGLAARLDLEFTPRVLGDGQCLVRFQAPNGEFQVPVRFVAQRCQPRLERTVLEFGDLVLGTMVKRSVLLRNTGSKGCRFTFRPAVVVPEGTEEEEEEGRSESPREVVGMSGTGESQPVSGLTAAAVGSRPPDAAPITSVSSTFSPDPSTAAAVSPDQHQTSSNTATGIITSILDQLLDRLPVIDFDGGLGVCGSGEGELPAGGRARLHIGCVADLEGVWRQQFIVEFDDPTCEPPGAYCGARRHEALRGDPGIHSPGPGR